MSERGYGVGWGIGEAVPVVLRCHEGGSHPRGNVYDIKAQ